MKTRISRLWRYWVLLLIVVASPSLAAERLVGLQSAPSIAMAVPWFAEEARLHSKIRPRFSTRLYRLFGQIRTAAMSGGNGSVAIVGGEGPIRALLERQYGFCFHRFGEER